MKSGIVFEVITCGLEEEIDKEGEEMRKVLFVSVIVFFVTAFLGGQALAKDTQNNGKPFQELWDAIENIELMPGPQGPQGEPGPQGEQGPQGVQGATGDTGPQGSQGSEGPQGSVGSQGEVGPPGEVGPQGPEGIPCQVEKNCWQDGNTHLVTMMCDGSNTTSWPVGKCGDGILDNDCEECDDGNSVDGDGCASVCTVEEGWVCDPDSGCQRLGLCEGDGEYCLSNDDCALLPGTCPKSSSGSYGESCNDASDCFLGWCTTSNNACTNDTNCYLHTPGSCVWSCPNRPANDCILDF